MENGRMKLKPNDQGGECWIDLLVLTDKKRKVNTNNVKIKRRAQWANV
jgi:hypothetical protein